jgi:DNA-binding MarR family transcriptional regulator
MLYPVDEHPADAVVPATSRGDGASVLDDAAMAEAVTNLRALIMAGESYRLAVAGSGGLGTTESQAISYLAVHGPRGQSELARDLGLTSSAATALVDRLERHGAAERTPHPTDRRRTLIRLTARGEELAVAGQQPLLASLGLVESADLPIVSSWLKVIAGDLHARTR